MSSKSISLNSITKPFVVFFRKFHLMLFFIVIVASLILAVALVNKTVNDSESESENYTSSITAGSIDDATLQRLQSLRKSSDPAPDLNFPSGRINPFAE